MQRRLQALANHLKLPGTRKMSLSGTSTKIWPAITLSDGNRIPAIGFGVGTAFFQDSSRKTVDALKEA